MISGNRSNRSNRSNNNKNSNNSNNSNRNINCKNRNLHPVCSRGVPAKVLSARCEKTFATEQLPQP